MTEFEKIVQDSIRLHAPQMEANLRQSALLQRLLDNLPTVKPPTRWQRLRISMLHWKWRLQDTWLVLSGKATAHRHEDEYDD